MYVHMQYIASAKVMQWSRCICVCSLVSSAKTRRGVASPKCNSKYTSMEFQV